MTLHVFIHANLPTTQESTALLWQEFFCVKNKFYTFFVLIASTLTFMRFMRILARLRKYAYTRQVGRGSDMTVDLSKVEAEAPHLVDLYKQAGVILEKSGLDPRQYKAAVVGTWDHSGSTEMGRNRLYSSGLMQEVADLCFVAGLQFDDDGSVPASLFDSSAHDLGEVTLGNCRGFMNQHKRFGFGGTSYTAALRWIIDQANFGRVDLGAQGNSSGGWGFRRRNEPTTLSVKATAPYPTYALFVTDGEPQDPGEAKTLLTLMSQLPIFVQFIGVGSHDFEFLRELDDMDGRLIDNASFFDAKEVSNDQGRMLELMLREFPQYYRAARQIGLVTG